MKYEHFYEFFRTFICPTSDRVSDIYASSFHIFQIYFLSLWHDINMQIHNTSKFHCHKVQTN